jgi:nucleotide-binding universal stress UspA family protein
MTEPFTNVVVGVGGVDPGRDAVALATRLAGRGARLTLGQVQVVARKPSLDSGMVREAAEHHRELDALASLRGDMHVDAELVSVKALSVARGLRALVEEEHADLLVIGESRRGELDRDLEGDDVREVLRDSPAAVAVAPRDYVARQANLKTIGVAYDESRGSVEALTVAKALAAAIGADVSVYHAPSDIERDASYGDVADELDDFSGAVDLLVMGPHHYRALDGRVGSGSLAQQLAERPASPLLVLARS